MTISAAAIQDVLALNAHGVSHYAISRSVGISRSSVQRIVRRPPTHTISARLSHPLFDHVKRGAAATGHTLADELRHALTSYYSVKHTQGELTEER